MSDAIKAAAARADEMIRNLAAGKDPLEGVDPEPAEATEVEAPPVVAASEPVPPPASAAPDEMAELRAEVAQLKKDYGLEHQRYKSLQGMIDQRDRTIEQLNEILATMHTTPAPAPAAAASVETYVTPEDEEAFGSDLIDLTQRSAKQVAALTKKEMAAELEALRNELRQIQSQVGNVQQERARAAFESFSAQVAEAVNAATGGRFDEINNAREFMEWIQSSQARTNRFVTARDAMDLEGVLTIYETYARNTFTGKQDVSQTQPSVDPRLARQVAPGKSRSTPSPAERPDGAKRQWTRQAIAEFYQNKASLPKESADALERDLFNAQREGRIA
jgi:hypothetical protein